MCFIPAMYTKGGGKSEEGDYCSLAMLAHQEEWEGSQVLSTVPETILDDDHVFVISTLFLFKRSPISVVST